MKMLWLAFLLSVLSVLSVSHPLLADGGVTDAAAPAVPCAQSTTNDTDGMPLCPDTVTQDSAWQLWRCAYNQVNAWHPPTSAEKDASAALIRSWAKERAGGQTAATASSMLAAAKAMGASVCRAKTATDSYLVLNAAPGVRDYAGGNLLLREASKVSKLVMILPHSDSDGYFAAGPEGFAGSQALAYIGNGHMRGHVAQGKDSDFVHHIPNLAYSTAQDILQAFPKHYLLHLHGDKATTKGLYRPQDGSEFGKAYVAAVEKETRVTSFGALNAGFTTDNLPFQAQIKSELPAVIYMSQHQSIARIVTELERSAFLWDAAPALTDGDPVYQDGEVAVDIGSMESGEENVPDNDGLVDLESLAPVKSPTPSPSPKPWAGPPHISEVGTHPINAVVPQWSDLKPGQQAVAQQAANGVAAFYKKMSRGRLTMVGHGVQMDIALPHTAANLGAACQAARKLGGWKTMMFDTWRKGGNHASGCAYLCQYTGWVDEHEVGHLLGLAHAGTFSFDPAGKPSYQQYGDNSDSVMADAVGSPVLTTDEVYYLGWLDKTEYDLVTDKTPQTFVIHSIDELAGGAKDMTFAAILHPDLVATMPASQGRSLMLAYPHKCAKKGETPCVSLTYMSAASATYAFPNQAHPFHDTTSGLNVTVVGMVGQAIKVSVAFD